MLSVIDSGLGIQIEDQRNLFQMFGCVQKSRKMNSQGVGLGLYISKLIVEEFGGAIAVQSQFESGSQFTFCFELEEMPA